MKATHTPGPWIVRCHDMVYDANNRLVADCENLDKSKRPAPPVESDMANARLIAAAPELLQALEDVIDLLALSGHDKKARAAISKARGEA